MRIMLNDNFIDHLLRTKAPAANILNIIEADPSTLTITYGEYLPIHIAAHYAAPEEVLLKMIELYPDSLKRKDYYNRLPIHHAANNRASEAVLLKMMESYKDSLENKDNDNKLPIHHAANNGASEVVLL